MKALTIGLQEKKSPLNLDNKKQTKNQKITYNKGVRSYEAEDTLYELEHGNASKKNEKKR